MAVTKNISQPPVDCERRNEFLFAIGANNIHIECPGIGNKQRAVPLVRKTE